MNIVQANFVLLTFVIIFAQLMNFTRPYDPAAYEVAELSDSAEHRLLQEIQKSPEHLRDASSSPSSSSEHTQQSTVKRSNSATMHYRRDSDSAEETISTLTPHVSITSLV